MEQNTDIGTPITPAVENKQKSGNGLKITTAVACVVVVCGMARQIRQALTIYKEENRARWLEYYKKEAPA